MEEPMPHDSERMPSRLGFENLEIKTHSLKGEEKVLDFLRNPM